MDKHRFPVILDQQEIDFWEEQARTEAALDAFLWGFTRFAYAVVAVVAIWLVVGVFG